MKQVRRAVAGNCPGPEPLKAFTVGCLSPSQIEAVFRHLESCAACQSVLLSLSDRGDPVISRLRSSGVGGEASVGGDPEWIHELVEPLRTDLAPTAEGGPLVDLAARTGVEAKTRRRSWMVGGLALIGLAISVIITIQFGQTDSPSPRSQPSKSADTKSTTTAPPRILLKVEELGDRPTPTGALTPFITYEAESGTLGGGAAVVRLTSPPSSDDSSPELEASGRAFVNLSATGDYVQWTASKGADAYVLRYCIPDSAEGGGLTGKFLGVHVNGRFRGRISLDSVRTWLYGTPGKNGQSNAPSAGQAHVFWNETRGLIPNGPVKAGDVIRLQKDSVDGAAYYKIDLLDLETQSTTARPTPAAGTFISVLDHGAVTSDGQDDTAAIKKAIVAAKSQGKDVWMPAGVYQQTDEFVLDGVKVYGAGPWATRLNATVAKNYATGFKLSGTGAAVIGLQITNTAATQRNDANGKTIADYGITGSFATNYAIDNVWVQGVGAGMWLSGGSGSVTNCRVLMNYAEGINVNRGAANVTVSNNYVRGCGDDAYAILSGANDPATRDVTFTNNTAVAPWWGSNFSLSGGSGHVVENNHLSDGAGFVINLTSAYPSNPLSGARVQNNTVARCGRYIGGQKRGAIWVSSSHTTVDGVSFQNNTLIDSFYRGIHLTGASSQNVTFSRNRITNPGAEDAIFIPAIAAGTGTFDSNTVTGLAPGKSAVRNSAGPGYVLVQRDNSWQ